MKTNERVRRLLDTTELSNPHDVARALLNELDNTPPITARADLYRATLAEVLPTFVQVAFSRARMLDTAPLPTDDAPRPAAGSAKVAACRDAWEARKNTPVSVPGCRGWKRLADCTAADLLAVAADLRARAAKAHAKADWYESVAGALPEGATVAALDTDPTAVTR